MKKLVSLHCRHSEGLKSLHFLAADGPLAVDAGSARLTAVHAVVRAFAAEPSDAAYAAAFPVACAALACASVRPELLRKPPPFGCTDVVAAAAAAGLAWRPCCKRRLVPQRRSGDGESGDG